MVRPNEEKLWLLRAPIASHENVFIMENGAVITKDSSTALGMTTLRLSRAKLERAVFGIDMDDLALVDFAFQNVDAERVENFFLDRAFQRARAVNRIVTFARDQVLGRIGKIERDLLLFEPFRQATKLDFDDLLEVVLGEAIENDDLIDAIEKLG